MVEIYRWIGRLPIGAAVALTIDVATAQAVAQSQSPTQALPAARAQTTDQALVIAGCVEREADYRRTHRLGDAGASVANQFVLSSASLAPTAPTGQPQD